MDIEGKKYIFVSSGISRVLEFLNSNFAGKLFLIDDLSSKLDLTYTSIRTILCNLCDDDIILRICRGVYYYPYSAHSKTYPSIIEILKYLSIKGNYQICPMGDYLEYCLGIRENFPINITCYTTGKLKSLKLYTKTAVKFVPRKRNVYMGICPWNVMLLAQYITDNNTAVEQKKMLLTHYIQQQNITNSDIANLPDEIKKKILILLQPRK
jgi:predicted transcriptional regulator